MPRIDKLIEKAEIQATGMKELGASVSSGAPFAAQQLLQKAAMVRATNEKQEAAKATQKSSTKELAALAKTLGEMVARNVAFFQGKLGKKDTRLPKLAGKILSAHGGRPRKRPQAQ